MAGPDKPPVKLAKIGLRVLRSMRIPKSVLIIVNPSAPPASTALAIGTISVTFGESLTYTGTLATFLTAAVKLPATSGSVPNAIPP